ncbi:non-homologous end-joining DNA ligase [Legionella impletisoli]|uniref:DNA ligase (ATP) n=1 Tax=Legionella impletisoli TaxID=343510 RepID=A0A917N809_9GAMM|nr:non-homologous end-joining DNA ligase [Legionella impletisoli]GGI76386.1 ATP-dependent DNA ligase [Legionella impletisoli]
MMNKLLNQLPSNLKKKLEKRGQSKSIDPMLATLTHDYFSDEEWMYERKLDGERCLLYKKDDEVSMISRNHEEQKEFYPEIANALKKMSGNFILDCELVTFDKKVTSFERLQHRMHVKNPDENLLNKYPVYAYVFDFLYYDGYGLEQLPLRKRKYLLKQAFHYESPIRYLPHRNQEGERYLKTACDKDWEGLIAKDATSSYVHNRSKKWLKFKCVHQQEFVIGGYSDPQGERIGFGALLIGYYDEEELKFAGRVGTGFDDDFLEFMHKKMKKKEQDSCPFDDYDGTKEHIHWIKPELVGEVGFTEWTQNGKLRHPRFVGLRKDKDAKDVHREDKSNA